MLALLLLASCASTSSASPRPAASQPETSAEAEIPFRVEPASADEDPGFAPPLAATIDRKAQADTITFGWKAPCKVPARSFKYRSDKGSAITRMQLEFLPREGGYRLRLSDFDFEMFNGQAIDSPELRAQVQQVLAMTAASMPEFLISEDGHYAGIVGLEEMVDALLEELGPDAPEGVVAAMKHPDMLRQLETSLAEYWGAWVEAWDGRTMRQGDTVVEKRRLGLLEGSMVVDMEVAHLGTTQSDANLRLLRTHQVIEGDAAREMMMAQVRKLARQTGGPTPPDDAIQSVRRVSTLYVVIEPSSARPHRTRLEKLIEVDDKRRLEIVEWEFDWANAEGC